MSVHLTKFPTPDTQAIKPKLSQAMEKVQTIVTLGLSWRSKKKIRVRQPLSTITIGFDLEPHFQDIITDELNIKQIIVDQTINTKVLKICKPDARVLGPKYGKEVQTIIQTWKKWEFEELKNWEIKIGKYILQANEYQIDYIKTDENLDIEAAHGMVISIDPNISPELLTEWYARDLIRFIQEARKEANFDIADRVQFAMEPCGLWILKQFKDYIQEETLSTYQTKLEQADISKTIELGTKQINFHLKKS